MSLYSRVLAAKFTNLIAEKLCCLRFLYSAAEQLCEADADCTAPFLLGQCSILPQGGKWCWFLSVPSGAPNEA